jgi:alkanesulfonate monooxygenase SsuD/methylene tetrahydromethanopterin reductase-like flavin-dependent oxidoreductase (luciferase family)
VRFGVFLFASVEDSAARAARAEREGFDSVWFPEFLTRRPDGREHAEPLVAMSYAAARTRRIGFGTAVLGVLRRHPAVLAQEAATLARLSGRRVVLGLGVGARRQDVALGIWRHVDADYLSEYVGLLRAFWAGGPVTFSGRHFSVAGATPAVAPPSGMQVLIGGYSEDSRRAAAAAGDGWLANWLYSPGTFGRLLSEVRDFARRAGRDPSGIMGGYLTGVAIAGDAERQLEFARELAFGVMPAIQLQDYGAKLLEAEGFRGGLDSPSRIPEEFVRRTFLLGGPDEAIGRLEEYARAGVDEMLLHFMDERSEREFARRVIPYFRDGELAR